MAKVRMGKSAVHSLEHEAAQVDSLLAQPESTSVSVDGASSSAKCLQMEEYSLGHECSVKSRYGTQLECSLNIVVHSQMTIDWSSLNHTLVASFTVDRVAKPFLDDDGLNGEGALDSDDTPEDHELKLEVLDGLLDEVDEVDDIHATNDLSTACANFLMDIEFVEKVPEVNNGPREKSRFQNPRSASHSPGCSGSSNGTNRVSDSSTTTILESEGKNHMPDNVSLDMKNLNDEDDYDNCTLNEMLSHESKKGSVKVKRVGASLRLKRSYKSTPSDSGGFSSPISGYITGGQNIPAALPKYKDLKVDQGQTWELDQGIRGLSGISSQTLHRSRPRRGHSRKFTPVLTLDSEDDFSDSEDEHAKNVGKRSKTVADRRKHQRMWTISEVTNLVDGVSQFGVGKWTDIKRRSFASSAYRTPIDLRDKWRNLLRTCCVQKQKQKSGKKEIEKKPKHAVRPLPKSVVRRINELATVQPYPRDRNMKLTRSGHAPSVSATQVDCVSPSERSVRRKKSS